MPKREVDRKMAIRRAFERLPDRRPWEARRYEQLKDAPCWVGTVLVDCGRWSTGEGEVSAVYAVSHHELYVVKVRARQFAGHWGPAECVARFGGVHHAQSVIGDLYGRKDVVGDIIELADRLAGREVVMSRATYLARLVAA